MRKYIAYSLFIVTILWLTLSCTKKQESNNWQSLSTEISDWNMIGDAKWETENNVLTASKEGGGGFAVTQERFGDFHLKLEFFPDAEVNSGIFVRCASEDQINEVTCYELNIWDDHVDQGKRTGAIVGRAKPLARVETVGKWNTYEIKAEGNRIQAWINGAKTADITDDSNKEGVIALQFFNAGQIQFRNLTILEL